MNNWLVCLLGVSEGCSWINMMNFRPIFCLISDFLSCTNQWDPFWFPNLSSSCPCNKWGTPPPCSCRLQWSSWSCLCVQLAANNLQCTTLGFLRREKTVVRKFKKHFIVVLIHQHKLGSTYCVRTYVINRCHYRHKPAINKVEFLTSPPKKGSANGKLLKRA